MGEEVPYLPANEGGAIPQASRGRLQDPLSETYLQYRYVAGVDVEAEAPHVAALYEQRDGPLYYYGTGIQNFWNDRGSDYTGAEYWVAFPKQLADVEGSVAPLAPSAELAVETFGRPLGDGAQRDEDPDGTAFIRLDAAAADAQLAVRRAVWGDRSKQSLVGVKVRTDGAARLEVARTSVEAPFAEIVVPDTGGAWRYVWLDLNTEVTPGAVGDNIVFLRAIGSDAQVDVAGVLAQANGVLTPPVFADAPAVDVMTVRGETWTRTFAATDAGGGAPGLALQTGPAGATLAGGTGSWTPTRVGQSELLVVASDDQSVTALPVSVQVAPTRPAAIGKLMDRVEGGAEDYTSASWQRVASLREEAQAARKSAAPAEFADLLRQLGEAIAQLQPLNPRLADGSRDFSAIATAPGLTSAQLRALVDGDNQTSWGDQRVSGIVFDFGPGFRVAATEFGFQARDTFPNRAEGTNVYGSDDGVTWTLLTDHPNVGDDAEVEWIPVRADAQDQRFRFLKFQVDEPGVPSDPAYPGIWSIADIRIAGTRTEATGSMDTVTMSSPDGVAGRVVAGDHVELRMTGPEGNTDVAVTMFGQPAQVESPAPGEWLATASVPAAADAGGAIAFEIAFTTPDGKTADPVAATTDGSKLFLSTDVGLIDDAVRGAAVLRPDGGVDDAWTQYTARMLDGDAATHSDTRLNSGIYGNVWDFGAGTEVSLTGAELLVRQDGYGTSRIADMRLEGSNDMQTWTRLTPAVPAKTLEWQRWTVTAGDAYRYIRLVNGQILNVAELHLYGSVAPVG
jgi:hypothetical protein